MQYREQRDRLMAIVRKKQDTLKVYEMMRLNRKFSNLNYLFNTLNRVFFTILF